MTRIALALILIFAASSVDAHNRLCGPRDSLVSQIEGQHGETRRSVGLQRNAQVMETYANDETGSWTIIVAMPSGLACLVAAGEAFHEYRPAPPPEGDPS